MNRPIWSHCLGVFDAKLRVFSSTERKTLTYFSSKGYRHNFETLNNPYPIIRHILRAPTNYYGKNLQQYLGNDI